MSHTRKLSTRMNMDTLNTLVKGVKLRYSLLPYYDERSDRKVARTEIKA